MATAKKKIHYAWWILVALCLIVGLSKGALNTSSGLFIPGATKDLDILTGNLTLYFSIASIVTMIFLPIGGKILAKYDIRTVLVIAIILQAGSYVGFGFSSSVWGWYIFAVPLAVGGVFTTVIVGPVLVNQWFKKKNGMALGLIGASGGLLGAIAQPIIGYTIATAEHTWRTGYIGLGLAVIIIVVPTVLLVLRKSPQAIGLLPYGAQEITDVSDETKTEEVDKGVTLAIARKSSAFYSLFFFFLLITSIASFAIHIPSYIQSLGYDAIFAGNAMAGYMIGVLLGALALGYLVDKIGSRNTVYVAMILAAISVLALLFISDSKIVIVLATALYGFTVSNSVGTLAPALTTSLFGSREYAQIYSTASLGLAIAGIVALPAYGYIYDFAKSYTPALYIVLVLLIINIVLVTFAFEGKKKLLKQGHWN
ncbi:MFS transporter [Sporosarcina gallistercoris]|uniref:MFS transporter n=1 Tax=Sporosarcina gallistercoris TaxID=2762245 RepID=A0ABR8PHK8_9BACL|nr:MFS transporter [Sporosarcina gallistercoris]MBD7907658.1 MFS transporter [Sporosarcina gallistercoris]